MTNEETSNSNLKEENIEKLEGETCPICHKKSLTLMQSESEVPFFGRLVIFSMTCSECNYHKADVEAMEQREPCKYALEVSCEDDMKIRIIKSSEATLKIPHVVTITPGPASEGYISNIESVLNKVKANVELARDTEEDPAAKKKAKNLLKKLNKVMWGQEKLKITLEDPTGNSAIISDKAVKS